jgi:hypothetical protein
VSDICDLLLRAGDIEKSHPDVHSDLALYELAGIKQAIIEACGEFPVIPALRTIKTAALVEINRLIDC